MSSPSGRRAPARGGRPGAPNGPGRSARSRAAAPSRTAARATRPEPTRTAQARPTAARSRPAKARPRFTGRAAILVLVLAVLAVSYASSLRAYLVQRSHIQGLQQDNQDDQRTIDAQEREVALWQDSTYLETQARERLGMVMPGETPYVVLKGGQPLEAEGTLSDPDSGEPTAPVAWWNDTWDSVLVAGNPPKRTDPLPATRIDDPEGAPSE